MLHQREDVYLTDQIDGRANEFGQLIFIWRGHVKRPKVLAHLPGWSKDTLHRLEKGEIAPAFNQLRTLFEALWHAGAVIPPDGVQLYIKYARAKISTKRTHLDYHSDEEWAELAYDLAIADHNFRVPTKFFILCKHDAQSSPYGYESSHWT